MTDQFSRYYTIFKSSALPSIILSPDGKIEDYNTSAITLFFDTHFDVVNNNSELPVWLSRTLKHYLDSGLKYSTDIIGHKRYEIHISSIGTMKGENQGYIVELNDITLVYEQSSELEKLKVRYETAISGSRDGLWDWNIETNEVYFSPRWKEMLGYEDHELKNELQTWVDLVHPDDLEQANADIAAAQQQPGLAYENIHRLLHKDGYWIWNLDRGETIFNEEGEAIRMVGFHTDITDMKVLQNMLEDKTKEFESFMENIPAKVCIRDAQLNMLFSNTKMDQFVGTEKVQEGYSLCQYLKDNYPVAARKMFQSIQEHGFAEEVIDIKNADDEYETNRIITFEITNSDLFGVMAFDITKEYKAKHEVMKFKQIIDKSPVSIVITDTEGNLEYVNEWFTKVTGYSYKEAIGENPRILKSDYHNDLDYIELWESITHDHVWTGKFKNIKKSGEEYWENAIIAPLKNEYGEIVNFLGVKQEITEQVLLEQKLLESEEIMIAQSRHAAMGEMISMIAHQWRQPISVISMDINNILADIELDMLDVKALKDSAHDIIKQIDELSKTIDDFRNFFKPDKLPEEVYLVEVLKELESVMGKTLSNHNIEFEVKIDPTKKITTYARELLQVLINLVKNAKEAVIEQNNAKRSIAIELYEKQKHYVISISDNGGGIADDVIEHIFEPYYTTKGEKNGTGLGLYMSKVIIEKHLHGMLHAKNNNGGALFEVLLPLHLSNQGNIDE